MKLTNFVCAIAVLLLLGVIGYRHDAGPRVTPDDRLILAEDLPAMQAALAAGADPQGAEFPALSSCVVRNFVPGVELLLEKGARPDGAPHSRPLILAVARGQFEVTTLLLQYGANPNITNSHGKTALQILEAMSDPDPRIRQALLAAGAAPLTAIAQGAAKESRAHTP